MAVRMYDAYQLGLGKALIKMYRKGCKATDAEPILFALMETSDWLGVLFGMDEEPALWRLLHEIAWLNDEAIQANGPALAARYHRDHLVSLKQAEVATATGADTRAGV